VKYKNTKEIEVEIYNDNKEIEIKKEKKGKN